MINDNFKNLQISQTHPLHIHEPSRLNSSYYSPKRMPRGQDQTLRYYPFRLGRGLYSAEFPILDKFIYKVPKSESVGSDQSMSTTNCCSGVVTSWITSKGRAKRSISEIKFNCDPNRSSRIIKLPIPPCKQIILSSI
jgi:hypothetical protein